MKSNICIYKNRGIATKPQLPKLQLQTDMLTFFAHIRPDHYSLPEFRYP